MSEQKVALITGGARGIARAITLDLASRGWSVAICYRTSARQATEVIDTVSRVVGKPVAWEKAPRRPGDPAVLYAAADRARTVLGWRPQYTELEVIVRHAWQWHSSHPWGYRGSTTDH